VQACCDLASKGASVIVRHKGSDLEAEEPELTAAAQIYL
jgi:hypothetical protein